MNEVGDECRNAETKLTTITVVEEPEETVWAVFATSGRPSLQAQTGLCDRAFFRVHVCDLTLSSIYDDYDSS